MLRETVERFSTFKCECGSLVEKLRSSEKKYRELINNISSVILRIYSKGEITFANEYARGFFGYSEEELLGKNATPAAIL